MCLRPLGRRVEKHHLVPKSRGGRDTVLLHPICHRTLHRQFDHATLVKIGTQRTALLDHREMARFVRWIDGKPPDFHAPTHRRSQR